MPGNTPARSRTSMGLKAGVDLVGVANRGALDYYDSVMKKFFAPNIDQKGRLIRASIALGFFVAAGFGMVFSVWLGIVLGVAGIFTAIEALRGWCIARACGIKTKH